MIEAAFGSPAIRTLGVASGDHQMSTELGSIVIGRMADKDKAITSMARDMRTYVDEFSFDASVINQVTLKVGKSVRVTDKVTGIEVDVDTLLSPEGEPAEVWIWEGEENGRVYRELIDKYHEIAQTSGDTTAIWVSFRPETEESKGQNNRIYKAEKQGDEVLLTSYTVGGLKDSMRQFLSDLSQSPTVPDNDLLKNTVFFHPKEDDVSHGKIFGTLTRVLSVEEQMAYAPHLEKFHKELAISDSERRLINERKERHFIVHMQDEMLKDKDIEHAFGVVAQSVVSLVEQTNQTLPYQSFQTIVDSSRFPDIGELVTKPIPTLPIDKETLEDQIVYVEDVDSVPVSTFSIDVYDQKDDDIEVPELQTQRLDGGIDVIDGRKDGTSLQVENVNLTEATLDESTLKIADKRRYKPHSEKLEIYTREVLPTGENDDSADSTRKNEAVDLAPFIHFLDASFVYQAHVDREDKSEASLAQLAKAIPPEELSKDTLPNEGDVLVKEVSAFITGMVILADGHSRVDASVGNRQEFVAPAIAVIPLLESIIDDMQHVDVLPDTSFPRSDDTFDFSPFRHFLEASYVYKAFVDNQDTSDESKPKSVNNPAVIEQETVLPEVAQGSREAFQPPDNNSLEEDISALMTCMVLMEGITLDSKARDVDPAETRDEEKPEEIVFPAIATVHLLESIIKDISVQSVSTQPMLHLDEKGNNETITEEGKTVHELKSTDFTAISDGLIILAAVVSENKGEQKTVETVPFITSAITGLMEIVAKDEVKDQEGKEEEEMNETRGYKEKVSVTLLIEGVETKEAVFEEKTIVDSYLIGLFILADEPQQDQRYDDRQSFTVQAVIGFLDSIAEGELGREESQNLPVEDESVFKPQKKLAIDEAIERLIMSFMETNVEKEGGADDKKDLITPIFEVPKIFETAVFSESTHSLAKKISESSKHYHASEAKTEFVSQVVGLADDVLAKRFSDEELSFDAQTIDSFRMKFIYYWIGRKLIENNYSQQKTKKTLILKLVALQDTLHPRILPIVSTRHHAFEKVLDILILLLLLRLGTEKEVLAEVMRLLCISKSVLRWVEKKISVDQYSVEYLPTFVSRYNTFLGNTAYQNKAAVFAVGSPVRYGTIYTYSPRVFVNNCDNSQILLIVETKA